MVDDFNRADGGLGATWLNSSGLAIASGELRLTTTGSVSPVWNGAVFGPEQEAYLTLTAITATSPEHDLMLKVQGTTWSTGHIEVRYDNARRVVMVSTYTPSTGWKTIATSSTMTFVAGDRLGARARQRQRRGVEELDPDLRRLGLGLASTPRTAVASACRSTRRRSRARTTSAAATRARTSRRRRSWPAPRRSRASTRRRSSARSASQRAPW